MLKVFLHKNFSSRSYFLTNGKLIFHRYCDSGFKTKWTGLWLYDEKFLEYFAFKVNGEWLSPQNVFSFEFDGKVATHYYKLKEMKVKEVLWLSGNSLKIMLELENETEEEKEVERMHYWI